MINIYQHINRALHKNRLNALFLFTTNRCNLNCVYCSTNSNNRVTGRLLSLKEQKKLIHDAKRIGIYSIIFCGAGEPMIEKNIFPLIEFSKKKRINPTLITNGTLITKENVKKLYKNNVSVQIKLESFNKKKTDKICGRKNSYEWVGHTYRTRTGYTTIKVPLGLKYLLNQYSSIRKRRMISINTVISKINYHNINNIAEFCKDNRINFNPIEIRVAGRAKKNLDVIALSKKEQDNVYEKMARFMGARFVRRFKGYNCEWRKNLCISEDGECVVCQSVNKSSGNIRNESLKILFEKSMKFKNTMDCNIHHYKRKTD